MAGGAAAADTPGFNQIRLPIPELVYILTK